MAWYHANTMSKQHFFVKLIPPRATFPMDITPEEKLLMQEHARYTRQSFDAGKILIYGPVMVPGGAFGMACLRFRTRPRCGSFWRMIPPCWPG